MFPNLWHELRTLGRRISWWIPCKQKTCLMTSYCLKGCGEFPERDQMAGLGKTVNDCENSGHTSWDGKSGKKADGDMRPRTLWYRYWLKKTIRKLMRWFVTSTGRTGQYVFFYIPLKRGQKRLNQEWWLWWLRWLRWLWCDLYWDKQRTWRCESNGWDGLGQREEHKVDWLVQFWGRVLTAELGEWCPRFPRLLQLQYSWEEGWTHLVSTLWKAHQAWCYWIWGDRKRRG